jgi:hypothetical protein
MVNYYLIIVFELIMMRKNKRNLVQKNLKIMDIPLLMKRKIKIIFNI